MAQRSLLVALAASLLVVLSAPFVGQIRGVVQDALPGYYRALLIMLVVGSVTAAVVLGVLRIRERRLLRYGLLASAVAGGVVYAMLTASGNADVDAVERFHFVEYGLLGVLFHRAWRGRDDATSLVLPVLAGIVVGTCDETFQWFVPDRVGELRDVTLNGAAVALGVVFAIGLAPPVSMPRVTRRARSELAWGVAGTTMVVALFFQTVHLGHEIRDEASGVFRSRFRAEDLDRVARERQASWSDRPPLRLRRLSREDQYLAEGLWHLQSRNVALGDRDFAIAQGENVILETWFGPVLDFPSFGSPAGARWSAEQAAVVARATAAGEAGLFRSTANPFPIYTWSRPRFLAAVLGVVAAIGLWGRGSLGRAGR